MTNTSMSAQVLILNKNWQPIATTGVERAFGLLFTGAAKALDDQYQAFDYESWADLGANLQTDDIIRTAALVLKIPRILVLQAYDKFPKKHIRFSRQNVYLRDDFTCQYCTNKFTRSSLNLDHVMPRCAGGKTSWKNVVASCRPCNTKKGGRTPEQADMRLMKKPCRPNWSNITPKIGSARYKEWLPFVDPVSAAYWNTELDAE